MVACVALLGAAGGCNSGPTTVDVGSTQQPPIQPPAPPPSPRADLFKHARVPQTVYRLLENGAFRLDYGTFGGYDGSWFAKGGQLTLVFWSNPPVWCKESWCAKAEASAVLRNDSLIVKYDGTSAWLLCNDMMDFDACESDPRSTYIRAR